jgi:hypothetical protein
MESLGKIFGSISRVKIIRLFLCNAEENFDKSEISKRTKINSKTVIKELLVLEKAGLIRRRSFFKEIINKKTKKIKKKRVQGFVLDEKFKYLIPLKSLLCEPIPMKNKEIGDKFTGMGQIKVVIVAGIFIQDPNSRLDLLIVGDNINNNKIKNSISSIESEIGRELKYAVFDTSDFKYRLSICDKLVRDIFDYPHEIVVDKIGLE